MPTWLANLITRLMALLAAIPVWGWIILALIALVIALVKLGKWLGTATPTVVGAGGTVTFPPPPGGTMFPTAGYQIRVTPTPPSPLSRAGTRITIAIMSAGTTVAGVPIRLAILPGADAGQTSMMDFGPNPAGVGSIVGTTANTFTDASGILVFDLKSTAQGDQDILEITGAVGGPAPPIKVMTYPYSTSPN
jgi:hypothetical protein